MRKLYYVPIVLHSQKEMGSLAKPLMEMEKRIFGSQAEAAHREIADRFWKRICQEIVEKKINTPETCKKLHIYVDALAAEYYCKTCFDKTGKRYWMDEIEAGKIQCPVCKRTAQASRELLLLKTVKSLIEQRLPQYLIIEKLMKKGAEIHSTERAQLLLEEHEMWQEAVKGITPSNQKKESLLQARDEFIARRICQTLPENEIGILFIGAAHKVDEELRKFPDIKVIYL